MADQNPFALTYYDEVRRSFRGYKRLADGGLAQLSDEEFFRAPDSEFRRITNFPRSRGFHARCMVPPRTWLRFSGAIFFAPAFRVSRPNCHRQRSVGKVAAALRPMRLRIT